MLIKIWNLLGSIKTVVPLLLVITLVSLIGILVPQGAPATEFNNAGLFASLILYLGLNHVFSTWWFFALLGLLSVNILVCSISRQLANARRIATPHFLKGAEEVAMLKCSTEFSAACAPNRGADLLSGYFKRRLYFSASLDRNSAVQVVSRSFYIKEIGSLLFHVSILFFFTGGILGGLTGFSFVKEFHKGEVHAIRDWHYRVRCDWFKVDKNDHGTVTDYTSKLSVLSSDSTPVFSHLIKVNHPLSYKGVRFYQYSYGRQPDAIDDAVLRISGPGLDSGLSEVFPFNTSVRLSTNDLKLTITNFVCDFDLDMGGEFVSSRSDKPNNPAIRVIISKGNDTVFDTWSFLNFPEIHRHVKNAYKITFLSYTPRYFTGIKISRDPGNVFVWLGFACMSFGIILVFYFPNKTYWIFMEPGNAGFSRIIVGASSGPALSAFQKEFKRTCASLKSLLKGEP